MRPLRNFTFFSLTLAALGLGAQSVASRTSPSQASAPGQESQVTVPSRPPSPKYSGEQGKQDSEITFTPATRMVTLKLRVEDRNGFFVPNIRRDNFAIYEDGVRQKVITAQVEHAPVSLALLVEFGSPYLELNKILSLEIPIIGRELLDVIGQDDKVAVFRYDSTIETLADFTQGQEALDGAFDSLLKPSISGANFYDAVLETLHRMQSVRGRKAVIILSTGLDAFSKNGYEQVLKTAQEDATPIYALCLANIAQRESAVYASNAPFVRIDWAGVGRRVEMLAKASGGRAYVLDSDAQLPAIYDDIMENLRLRYVVTYLSSNGSGQGSPRKVRVELIDPKTGRPLKIRDSAGKSVTAKVFVQESYTPATASGI